MSLLRWVLVACVVWHSATQVGRQTPKPQFRVRNDRFCATPSLHTVSGPGLSSAVAGQRADFDIQWAQGSRSSIYILAVNEYYMAAGEVNTLDGKLVGSYIVDHPGEYELNVNEVWFRHQYVNGSVSTQCGPYQWSNLLGSPFRLTVSGQSSKAVISPQSLPRCLNQNGWQVGNGWFEGGWVSSRLPNRHGNVLRDGWVYQPRDCSFDVFPYDHLEAASRSSPNWIVVLGTSVQRGIFLLLVDLLTQPHQKHGLHQSITTKCWGWSDFQLNQLRVTYVDWRMRLVARENITVCHGDNIAVLDSVRYMRDAWTLVNFLFRKGEAWPSIVVAEMLTLAHLQQFLRLAPPSWEGRIVPLVADSETIMRGESTFMSKYRHTKANLLQLGHQMQLQDPRVVLYWTFPALVGAATDLERPGLPTSHHHHRHCHEVSEQGMKFICSMEREMVSQILLGLLLGSKKGINLPPAATPTVPSTVTTCHDCPESLMPFQVNHSPNPQCLTVDAANFSFQLLPRQPPKAMVVRLGTRCPAACLKRPRDAVQATQSGNVDVRNCNTQTEG